MKIQGNKPPEGQEISLNAQKIAKADGKDKASAPDKARALNDKVEISGKGKEIAELMATVNQLPDVRTDKVEAVKKAIESGTYKIDSRKIAQKFLEEI
jgi:negative regulator of flagellin synthesis FlgM